MAFDPQFESQYIRQFAEIVRGGAPAAVYSEWTRRIRDVLSEIPDPQAKKQAQERVTRIGNYEFSHIEDAEGTRAGIAAEIEELADFVSGIRL